MAQSCKVTIEIKKSTTSRCITATHVAESVESERLLLGFALNDALSDVHIKRPFLFAATLVSKINVGAPLSGASGWPNVDDINATKAAFAKAAEALISAWDKHDAEFTRMIERSGDALDADTELDKVMDVINEAFYDNKDKPNGNMDRPDSKTNSA